MAKEKFDRSKPHINIGTIGHIDHREDDVNGSDHAGIGEEGSEGGVSEFRFDRQCAGGARARDHDRDGACGVFDGQIGTTRTWTVRVMRTTSRT